MFDRPKPYDGTDPSLVKSFYDHHYAGKKGAYCAAHRAGLLPRLLRATDPAEVEALRSEIRAIDTRLGEIAEGAIE